MLQYEKHLDQKDATLILLIRAEHKRFQITNGQLNDLKIRYAGSVPIQSLQRHQADLEGIRKQQLKLSDQLTEVRNERNQLKFKGVPGNFSQIVPSQNLVTFENS